MLFVNDAHCAFDLITSIFITSIWSFNLTELDISLAIWYNDTLIWVPLVCKVLYWPVQSSRTFQCFCLCCHVKPIIYDSGIVLTHSGHFLTQKELACQISVHSEQIEKSQRNRYIHLSSTEPFECVDFTDTQIAQQSEGTIAGWMGQEKP